MTPVLLECKGDSKPKLTAAAPLVPTQLNNPRRYSDTPKSSLLKPLRVLPNLALFALLLAPYLSYKIKIGRGRKNYVSATNCLSLHLILVRNRVFVTQCRIPVKMKN